VIVLLESDGIQFWCSSPVVTRMLVEKGARIVDAGAKAENLAHLVNAAIPADDLAPEGPRTVRTTQAERAPHGGPAHNHRAKQVRRRGCTT
jgi:hypothetical protein